ncbi:MAG: NAD(+)/NADH kinase [Gemmatimonadales bacterium]
MNIGIVGNPRFRDLADVLLRVAELAAQHGHDITSEPDIADSWGEAQVDVSASLDVDVLLSFGGDGTLLRGLRLLADPATPILGVNLGRVGFLTNASPGDLEDAYSAISRGDYETDPRHVICGSYQVPAGGGGGGGGERDGVTALNDIVMHHGGVSRVIYMRVTVDGDEVGQYSADGMIVSTPTGSTAYSLSAGGPILSPEVDALVVTPISAHTLAVRPLVVPGSATIRVDLVSRPEGPVLISYDGQVGDELGDDESLVVRRSPVPAQLIRLHGDGFFARMRSKLQWGDLSGRIPK